MQFSLFLLGSAAITNTALLGAIAVLACILGAEIAGICILISKMLRARQRHDREEDSYRNYAAVPFVLLGAIPQATYSALTVLLILTVAGALAFVALLIVFLACGYDFKATHVKTRAAEEVSAPAEMPSEDEQETEVEPDESEEQRQEAYTDFEESGFDELFGEENSVAEEEELDEESVEETDGAESTAVEPIVLQSQTSTVQTVEEPALADGTRPYKVVEKVVTETVTETYTETPPAEQKTAGLSDAVVEKLVDLLDYEIRTRREEERKAADAAETAKGDGSVATFVRMEDADDEDDDEDEDELEDRADGTRDEDDEDFDGEHEGDDDRFTGNERIIGFDEETGCYIVAHYRKSFEAKLIQARPNIKEYYSELKNALLSYKGSKSRISWTADSFHNGRTQIAKINVKTRILEIYLALDPASLEGTVYRGRDVGNKKKYAETPFQYKVRTPRKFKWAMELVARTCEEHGLSPIDIEKVDYEQQYPFDTTENLVSRKLIKEYIRQEKPATSFELDPDHVPALPTEDASVIPANANFSWEFDNERMEEQVEEPETVEESVEEPVAEPEPAEAPAPAAPQSTIVRETVKVTEMRYTERYYADETQTYEQTVTTTKEPIEAIAEAAETEDAELEPIEEMTETEDDALAAFAEEPETELLAIDEEEMTQEDEEIFFSDEEEATEESYEEQPYEETEEAYEEESYEEEPEEAYEEEFEEAYEETEEEPAFEEIVEEDVAPTPLINVNPSVALVDLCSIEEHFENGDVITLDELKARELVIDSAVTLKVYASGALSKAFTVEAHHFTLDAIRAISEADGDSVMVR